MPIICNSLWQNLLIKLESKPQFLKKFKPMVMLCADLYNFKNVKNTHVGCYFKKSCRLQLFYNKHLSMGVFTFFKLYRRYQIAQVPLLPQAVLKLSNLFPSIINSHQQHWEKERRDYLSKQQLFQIFLNNFINYCKFSRFEENINFNSGMKTWGKRVLELYEMKLLRLIHINFLVSFSKSSKAPKVSLRERCPNTESFLVCIFLY